MGTTGNGIDFNRTFGAGSNDQQGGTSGRSDKPAAKLWINLGYVAKGVNDDGSDRFVSIPVGIPVDTQEHLKTDSRNADYNAFQAARNDLLDQIVAAGANLEPGQDVMLNLTVQLRSVSEPRAAMTMTDDNRFARPQDAGALIAA